MDKVFITHSRHDAPILKHIVQLVKTVKVKPILYEYNKRHTNTSWNEIRQDIKNSHALFVVLSNNLSSSPHTQNWVGWEVGVACAFNKRVWVFEEIQRRISFPIPYFTDYVPYDLNDQNLRQLISAVARGYRIQPQITGTIMSGAIGALLFDWTGLFLGAIIGKIANKPKQAPYVNLMCYHVECKTRFRSYVWLDELECPACRRLLRFSLKEWSDGTALIYPNPGRDELTNSQYVAYNSKRKLQIYRCKT